MRKFFLILFLTLSIPTSAAAQLDEVLIPKAEQGNIRAQAMLGANYLFGREGLKRNLPEAYYWSSLCDYQASQLPNHTKEEMEAAGKTSLIMQDQTKLGEVMQWSMQQGLKQECNKLVEEARKVLNPAQAEQVDERIGTWKSLHPPVPEKAKTPQEMEAMKLGYRLWQEVNASTYDMTGINALIAKGADIKTELGGNSTLLMQASGLGRTDIMAALIKAGTDVNETTLFGNTALMSAASKGRAEAVALLIKSGARLENKDRFGETALFYAAYDGDAATMQELIKAGAVLDARDESGNTPLMKAASMSHLDGVKALVAAGADVHAKNSWGKEALDSAQGSYQHPKNVIEYLSNLSGNASSAGTTEEKKCSGETKTCPDGLTVRRSGPACVFSECPVQKAAAPVTVPVSKQESPSIEISKKASAILSTGTEEQKDKVISLIKENPGIYNPSALDALSKALFHKLQDDEAIFWFHAGQMRGHYDSLICSFHGSFSYSRYNEDAQNYTRQYPDKVKALGAKLLEWDKATPYNYDHAWEHPTFQFEKITQRTCLSGKRAEALIEDSRRAYLMPFDPTAVLQKLSPQEKDDMQAMVGLLNPLGVKPEMDVLKPQAEAGDKKAQFQLARCYESKLCKMPAADVKRRDDDRKRQEEEQAGQLSKRFKPLDITQGYAEEALKWMSKSADQGYPAALMFMADRYFSGRGVPKDPEKAKKIWLDLAAGGYTSAYGALGSHYMKDNPVEAYAWLRLSESYSALPSDQRMRLDVSLSEEQWAEAQKLAEKYHALYFKTSK